MKIAGWTGNYLAGDVGDGTNAVLAAVGHNFWLLLTWLAELWQTQLPPLSSAIAGH